MIPYFHNMGVATPSREVASNGPYVTFDNDPIHHIPNAMSDNLYNENRYYSHTNALGEKVEALTGAFHAFDYYLGTPTLINNVSVSSNKAVEKIKKFIVEKIQAHSDAPSQWKTDQELNKGTKDYKITVKHRFDSSVVMSEEVYPFAASKKLYYVDGNISGYVKASCGGYLIEDTWVGQNFATESKRLLHASDTLPHEILLYGCEGAIEWNSAAGLCNGTSLTTGKIQLLIDIQETSCGDGLVSYTGTPKIKIYSAVTGESAEMPIVASITHFGDTCVPTSGGRYPYRHIAEIIFSRYKIGDVIYGNFTIDSLIAKMASNNDYTVREYPYISYTSGLRMSSMSSIIADTNNDMPTILADLFSGINLWVQGMEK